MSQENPTTSPLNGAALAEIIEFTPNEREIRAAEAFAEKHQYTAHAVKTLAHVLRERWGDCEAAAILERVLPSLAEHESEVC